MQALAYAPVCAVRCIDWKKRLFQKAGQLATVLQAAPAGVTDENSVLCSLLPASREGSLD